MKRNKSLIAVVAAASAFTLAGITLAGPAAANPWGGTLPCSVSNAATVRGTKGQPGTGSMILRAGTGSWTIRSTDPAGPYERRGANGSQTWSVSGAGATFGTGFCS